MIFYPLSAKTLELMTIIKKLFLQVIFFGLILNTSYFFYSKDLNSEINLFSAISLLSFTVIFTIIFLSLIIPSYKSKHYCIFPITYFELFLIKLITTLKSKYYFLIYLIPFISFTNPHISLSLALSISFSSLIQILVTSILFLLIQELFTKKGDVRNSYIFPAYCFLLIFLATHTQNIFPLVLNPLGSIMGLPILFKNNYISIIELFYAIIIVLILHVTVKKSLIEWPLYQK